MQLHQLKVKNKFRKPKRLGRGGKRGTYSGRGLKGQKSRAGARMRPALRDLIKKIPKLRGYRHKMLRKNVFPLNLDVLQNKFESGEKVTPKLLLDKGIIKKINGKLPEIKLLGEGSLEKKLLIEGCHVSESAKGKIEKAGGQIK
jgi:large subunit ribosomal protein L15